MEKKFGFKDLVLFTLLIALLVVVVAAMIQYDRQWEDLRELRSEVRTLSNVQNQTRSELSQLRQQLSRGVALAPTTGNGEPNAAAAGDHPDPFDRLKAMRAEDDFAQGDTVIDAFGTKIKSVTAVTYPDLYGRRIQQYVLESLAVRDPDTLVYKPWLAESWQIDDNSDAYQAWLTAKHESLEQELADQAGKPDPYTEEFDSLVKAMGDEAPEPGSDAHQKLVEKAIEVWKKKRVLADPNRPPAMTITFTLRDNLTFSDGKPLTAHDVQFTWELVNNPRHNKPQVRNYYDNVETYKALDDRTIQFTFTEPHYQAFGMVTGYGVLPRHFYSKFDIEQDLNKKPGLLMGSGPYRLPDPETWAPGKLMQLVRNENYWGVGGGPDKLVWLEIEEDVARLIEFKNGGIDLFSATAEQYEDLLNDEAVLARCDPYDYKGLPSGYSFVGWNTLRQGKATMFADKRVRQAMTHLIDRDRIADEVLLGYAVTTSGPFDDEGPQADPSIRPRPYDVAKAKALLAEAGWAPGDDGVLRNAAGEPFRFALTYPSGSKVYDRIMLFIKDTLARAGIIMEQDPQEWSVFIDRIDGRAFDACALAWGGGAIESDPRQMFHSSQIADGANNFTNYVNPEFDKYVDLARKTIDEAQRMEYWKRCHRILYEDQPYTFMHRRKTLRFIDKRFKNVEPVTTGLNDRVEWYVPTPMQLRP